jgi:hypothetical protein
MAINNTPLGLLSLLNAKVGGVNPVELAQTIAPVIDMLPWYFQNNKERGFFNVIVGSAISINLFPDGIVPANEIWYVTDYCIEFINAAVGFWSIAPCRANGASTRRFLTGQLTTTANLGLNAVGQVKSDGPFFMTGGDQFGFFSPSIPAGSNVDGFVEFIRLHP